MCGKGMKELESSLPSLRWGGETDATTLENDVEVSKTVMVTTCFRTSP